MLLYLSVALGNTQISHIETAEHRYEVQRIDSSKDDVTLDARLCGPNNVDSCTESDLAFYNISSVNPAQINMDFFQAIIVTVGDQKVGFNATRPVFEIDDKNAKMLLIEYQSANYDLEVSLQYYTVQACANSKYERTTWAYGGFTVFTAIFSLWWLANTFSVNAKDATIFHKIVTVIPILKVIELLSRYYYWSNYCEIQDSANSASNIMYGVLYETSFYTLIFSLSHGIALTRKTFEWKEWLLFSIVIITIMILEMIYYDPTHSFNLYVFVILFCLCISGIFRTCITLNREYHIAVSEGKDRYLFLYSRKRCIFCTFVIFTSLFFCLEAAF